VTRSRTDRGAAALEFALAAPVLLGLMFGVIELSRALWTKAALQHGVQMAARCAAISAPSCTSNSATQSYAAAQSYGLNPPAATFAVSDSSCGKLVTASYSLTYATGLFNLPSVSLGAQSCFPT
jgi:Flp pilus assembly protein TadG